MVKLIFSHTFIVVTVSVRLLLLLLVLPTTCYAQVRQQHVERGVSFLSSELCVVCPEEAAEHIFFVSARETLDQCDMANMSPGRSPRDGWQARVREFADFERKFEVKTNS